MILMTKKSPMTILIRLGMENQLIIYQNYISIMKLKYTHLKYWKQILPSIVKLNMLTWSFLTRQQWSFLKGCISIKIDQVFLRLHSVFWKRYLWNEKNKNALPSIPKWIFNICLIENFVKWTSISLAVDTHGQ